MKSLAQRNPVLLFVLLTLGLQFGIVLWVKMALPEGAHLHEVPRMHMLFRFRVFGPLFFAVAITAWLEGAAGLRKLFGSFLHWRVSLKWYGLALVWKFLFAYSGILIVVVFMGKMPGMGWVMDGFFRGWLMNLPFIIGIAFVEETSWIRFSLTRMQMRYNAFWSAMIVGNLWGLWYLPMVFINEGVPAGYPIPVFHGCMIGLTVLLAHLYNSTRSGTVLLTAQIVSNTAFFIVPILPEATNDKSYVTAFSWVFISAAVLIVLVFGTANLSRKQRVRWDDDDAAEEEGTLRRAA